MFGRGYASGDDAEDLAYEFVKWERGRYRHALARLPPWMLLDEGAHGRGINANSNFRRNERGRRNSALLLSQMREHCERSQIAAMKEIRLTFPTGPNPRTRPCADHAVSNVDYVLDHYESAKIVHLVRHPAEVRRGRPRARGCLSTRGTASGPRPPTLRPPSRAFPARVP